MAIQRIVERLTIDFDVTDDPKMQNEINKIKSANNNDRYRLIKSVVATPDSTNDPRVENATIETLSTYEEVST